MDHPDTLILFLRRLRAAESQRGLIAATIDSAKGFEAYLRGIHKGLRSHSLGTSYAPEPLGFRESGMPEIGLPRISLLGGSVDIGDPLSRIGARQFGHAQNRSERL